MTKRRCEREKFAAAQYAHDPARRRAKKKARLRVLFLELVGRLELPTC